MASTLEWSSIRATCHTLNPVPATSSTATRIAPATARRVHRTNQPPRPRRRRGSPPYPLTLTP